MKKLIFVGGGGYFLELYDYVTSDIASGFLNGVTIKGVLDDVKSQEELPCLHLGKISSYSPKDDDIFIIAMGDAVARSSIYEFLCSKEANFFTYIHNSALVSPSASIGQGSIICPFSIVNARASVGQNVSVNVNCSIGHESTVGDHSVLSPYAALNGNSSIGQSCFLGTRATIYPKVSLGNKTTVDSHTGVRKSEGDKMLISERAKYSVILNRLVR